VTFEEVLTHATIETCPRNPVHAGGGDHLGKRGKGGNMDPVETQRRLAIAAASDKLWNGEITCSAFLRVCASAGMGLAACSLSRPRRTIAGTPTTQQIRATAGPSSAIELSSDQQEFLRDVGRVFAGQTVHVVTEDTPPSLATREIMQQECMPLTGINVEWEILPLDRVLAKVSADTASRQAFVVTVEVLWGCPRTASILMQPGV
jgi:hypothetical protein